MVKNFKTVGKMAKLPLNYQNRKFFIDLKKEKLPESGEQPPPTFNYAAAPLGANCCVYS